MDREEQAVVRQALRKMSGPESSKIGTRVNIASQLLQKSPNLRQRDADDYLFTRSVNSSIWEDISEAALDIILENGIKVMRFYERQNLDTRRYLARILLKYREGRITSLSPLHNLLQVYTDDDKLPLNPQESTQNNAPPQTVRDRIFSQWGQTPRAGMGSLRSGVYQVFRRYKPTRTQKLEHKPDERDWSKAPNHAVICELITIDLEMMECKMVTADLNIYHGSLCITHEEILYAIFRRPSHNNDDDVHQRILAAKVMFAPVDVISGILMKIGDTTLRPIAADVFMLYIAPGTHPELYDEFRSIKQREWSDHSTVSEDSVIANFISSNPPFKPTTSTAWNRVRYLSDFEALLALGQPTENYIALFREPLRTLDTITLAEVLRQVEITTFTQNKDREKTNS